MMVAFQWEIPSFIIPTLIYHTISNPYDRPNNRTINYSVLITHLKLFAVSRKTKIKIKNNIIIQSAKSHRQSNMNRFKLFLFLTILAIYDGRFAESQCLDENNESVDFFYAYKLPKTKDGRYDGYEYFYITSNTLEDGWKVSNYSLKDEKNLIARTLEGSMSRTTNILLTYNDEEPSGPNDDTGGHTKGVFSTDGNTGFWMIHSVPKFPDINSYSYPSNAVRNGQSFLCISINSSEIETIGEQFIYNEVNIYGSRIPENLKGVFTNLEDAIGKKWKKKGPFQNLKEFKSLNGTSFHSFAKGRKFAKELYIDWVAPQLGIDLLTETWRNGPGALHSNCSFSHR